MEIHGTRADANIPSELEGVGELREVTFVLTPDEIRALADFFAACANEAHAEHFGDLGSGLIDHNQKMTVAAIAMADMKVWAQRSYRV